MLWTVRLFLYHNFSYSPFAVEGILNYSIPEEKEDYTVEVQSDAMDIDIDPALSGEVQKPAKTIKSNLRLPPPPLFSRQTIPQIYKLCLYLNFRACILTSFQLQGESCVRYHDLY